MGIWQEFKQFAIKGNAIDMAVAIIVGTSFNKVVNSLVTDVIMPPIGMLLGGVDFKNLQVVLKAETINQVNEKIPAVALRYGLFINTIIDFLIVAFTIFMVVKMMNKFMLAKKPPVEEKK